MTSAQVFAPRPIALHNGSAAPAAPWPAPPEGPRPRLALVIGSGGVRGVAALGVCEVLAEAGVRPDIIVGCSSGALFGATIASGMSADQALQALTTLWSSEITSQRRWRAYAELVAPRLAGFGPGFALRADRLIAQRIAQAFGDRRLEDLPIPLRVAATVAATGESVILSRGRLVDALRASMAVPLLFPSVEFGGLRLVDGVISNPLPVAAARDADAMVVLALDGAMPRRVDRASRLVAQITTAMINNLQQARLDAVRAAGRPMVAVTLALRRHFGLWETRALPELFDAGRRAARLQLPQILAMLDAAARRRAR